MFDRNKCKTQWLIGIFVRLLSSKDDLMRETKFPLSTTLNSLPDCLSYAEVGRLKRFGEPFQLFLFYGVLSHSRFLGFKCIHATLDVGHIIALLFQKLASTC